MPPWQQPPSDPEHRFVITEGSYLQQSDFLGSEEFDMSTVAAYQHDDRDRWPSQSHSSGADRRHDDVPGGPVVSCAHSAAKPGGFGVEPLLKRGALFFGKWHRPPRVRRALSTLTDLREDPPSPSSRQCRYVRVLRSVTSTQAYISAVMCAARIGYTRSIRRSSYRRVAEGILRVVAECQGTLDTEHSRRNIVPEEVDQGISRRDLLKRSAALGGAVVWVTPLVQMVGMGRAFAQTASPAIGGDDGEDD